MTTSSRRIAVIEIGSRAVRLLVADVTGDRVQPVLTRSHETRLMGVLAQGGGQLQTLLAEMDRVIADFESLAGRNHAVQIQAFGTEAARRLLASGQISTGSALSRARIFTPAEEALCSALAALSARPEATALDGPLLVVDQGGGSLEVISAICAPDLRVKHSASLDLGVDALLERFAAHEYDLTAFRDELESGIAIPFEPQSFIAAFAQGSVATKCAWLSSAPPKGSRYDPRRAQGLQLGVRSLDAMIEIFAKTPYQRWDHWRAVFDPANPTSDDVERVVTGAIALSIVLRKFGISRFQVSAQGTRHGAALMMARSDH